VFTFSDPPFEPQPSVLPVVKLLKIKHYLTTGNTEGCGSNGGSENVNTMFYLQ
jgi:hypothetical protein